MAGHLSFFPLLFPALFANHAKVVQLVKALNHKICGNALTSVRDFCFLDFYLVRTQGLCRTPHLVTGKVATVAYKTFCFLFSSLFESGVGMYVHVAQV